MNKENLVIRRTKNGCEVYDLGAYSPDDNLTLYYGKAKVGEFTDDEIQWLTDDEILELCIKENE